MTPQMLMPLILLRMMLLILNPCAIEKTRKITWPPNTNAPDNDALNADADDAAPHDYLILDPSLKRKIYPNPMLKL